MNAHHLLGRVAGGCLRQFRPTVPVMVHQFAKVGSTSVWQELARVYTRGPVYHTHTFAEFDAIDRVSREVLTDPTAALRETAKGRKLRAEFEQWTGKPWKVVTLVRDPVARSLSLLFHRVEKFIPDYKLRVAAGKLPVREIEAIYRSHCSDDPSGWFDLHVREPFGIDVYSEPFPTTAGYHIYRGVRADVMMIRLEDLNRCWPAAARAFFGIKHTAIGNLNPNQRYVESVRNALVTEDVLDRLYDTRMVRHFYTPLEVARWRKEWRTRAAGGSAGRMAA